METSQLVLLGVIAYVVLFTIASAYTMHKLVPRRTVTRRIGNFYSYNEYIQEAPSTHVIIARYRAFWAGVFSPVLIPAFILYHLARGLYLLVTVPFRSLKDTR